MLVDANILLYAVDDTSPFHAPAASWLTDALNGRRRVGLPWQSLWGFIRISTNPRAMLNPLTPAEAWDHVAAWLDASTSWIPQPGQGHGAILRDLLVGKDLRANLVSDAVLAALCVEHGLAIVSADSDFARFPELTWVNPVVPT